MRKGRDMAWKALNFVNDPVPNRELSMVDDRLWRLDVAPKNIYVAAPLTQQGEASRFALQLMDAGFNVTSRWLRRDFSTKPSKDNWESYKALEEEMGRIDLEDVLRSDTLIILADKPSTSGGYHVELGIFLGAGRTNIIAVGNRPNVFFWLDNVRWTIGTEGLVEWLQDPRHGKQTLSEVSYIELNNGGADGRGEACGGLTHGVDDPALYSDSTDSLTSYDEFVEEMWFYDPAKHGGCPELAYTALKMSGEAGETAEKIGKIYRDNAGVILEQSKLSLLKELGDQLFYITKLAHMLGATLDDVARINREKLKDRLARGKMRGDGDDR